MKKKIQIEKFNILELFLQLCYLVALMENQESVEEDNKTKRHMFSINKVFAHCAAAKEQK